MKEAIDQKQQAQKYYRLGLTYKEISKLLDTSPRTVQKWITSFNKQRKKAPKENHINALKMNNKGITLVAIAKAYSKSPQTIKNWIKKALQYQNNTYL